MSALHNSTLVSLAILKANFENKRDFLEIFVPLVAEAIRALDNEIVVVGDVQQSVEDQFGLKIPQNTLNTILIRVKKRGYIRQDNRIFYRNSEQLGELEKSFRKVQQNVVRMYEELIKEFSIFCGTAFSIDLKEDDADSAFQIYLRENETKSSQQTVIPSKSLSKVSTKSVVYYVGMFIQHLEQSHSSHFDSWMTISTGNMLANSVFLLDPTQPNRRFRNTSIYFDTSFLINALGYAGEPRQAPCVELLELLYEVGADLRCFQHTLEEVRGILSACEDRIAQGQLKYAYGETLEYFISKRYSATDIALFSAQLERNLRAIRIEIEDKPDYKTYSLVIDEAGFKKYLNDTISYKNPDGVTVYRDVDSISAIIRLRRGSTPVYLEEGKALFVTANSDLARATKDFFNSENSPRAIPPCVTDYYLTTKVWLKKAHNAPNLPRKRIIADYYAAIQPSDSLLKQYYTEIEKLSSGNRITVEDYYLLRYSFDSKSGLMELTRGGEEPITALTIEEALAYIKDNMIAQEREKSGEIMKERDVAQSQLSSLQGSETERKTRIKAKSQKWANYVIKWIRRGVIVLVTVTTITTFPWSLPPIENEPVRYLLTLLQVLFLITSIINSMFGTPIETYIRRLEVGLAQRIETSLLQVSS